jgi:hypothetical protein
MGTHAVDQIRRLVSLARLTTVAIFPQYYILANLAARRDGSILVTAALHKELWYVPPADRATPALRAELPAMASPRRPQGSYPRPPRPGRG